MIPPYEGEPFGAYVRRCRRYVGLTQEQLAVKIDIGRAMICHIESGTRNPGVAVARRLVELLDLDPNAIPEDGRGKRAPDPLPSAPGGLMLLSWR